MSGPTYEQWIAALDSISAPSDDAMTIGQWAGKLGHGRAYAAKWVREGLDGGWMERAPMRIAVLIGGTRIATGFRLVAQDTNKSKEKRCLAKRST